MLAQYLDPSGKVGLRPVSMSGVWAEDPHLSNLKTKKGSPTDHPPRKTHESGRHEQDNSAHACQGTLIAFVGDHHDVTRNGDAPNG
jgi:hypothetical protein